jgi:CDP-diacylglycerol--glycerol-3-phosphate 3-phosphatidyltransferase
MLNTKELYTKSNMLSLFRLLMAIPIWFLLEHLDSLSMRYLIFSLCIFAAFTDILDGYLARKYNEVTEMGKLIDPLADKVLMAAIIVKLFVEGEVPLYYLLMIIGRDIIIFLGGIYVSKRLGKILPSNMLGKITVINIGLVILLILLQVDRNSFLFAVLYFSSLVLIVGSLIGYIIRAFEFLRRKNYGSI